MKVRKYLAYLAVIFVLAIMSNPVQADHSWADYHWARTSNPVLLQIVDNVTPDWQIELETAIDEWNVSGAFDMSVTSADDSKKARKRCNAAGGKMRVCNASYGYNGWLGLASINIDSNSHITKGVAKMNDSYSNTWNDPVSGDDEKRHVMCQEIGHVFGLGHTSEDGSSQKTCMDYSMDPNSISPNAHDYQLLADKYAHTDGYNSYEDGGSTGGGGCNAPPGKGCNKFGAGFGDGLPMGVPVQVGLHHEVWIAADGNGGYWVHHITLAPSRNNR